MGNIYLPGFLEEFFETEQIRKLEVECECEEQSTDEQNDAAVDSYVEQQQFER